MSIYEGQHNHEKSIPHFERKDTPVKQDMLHRHCLRGGKITLSSAQQRSSSSLPFSFFRGEGNCNSALAGSPRVGSMSSRGAERYSYACCPFHPIICKILPPARSAYRI